MRRILIAAAALVAGGMGLADGEGATVEVEGLVISGATARSSGPAARSAAGYFTITNTGERDDRLVGASSDAAQRVELHTHVVENGIARMVELEQGIEIPAGGSVVFEQGGLHVMFMGLTEQWGAEGGVVVTLVFERAGTVPVTLDPGRVGHTHDPHAHDRDTHGPGGQEGGAHGHGDSSGHGD
jgi:periplasmic copper chaperone A